MKQKTWACECGFCCRTRQAWWAHRQACPVFRRRLSPTQLKISGAVKSALERAREERVPAGWAPKAWATGAALRLEDCYGSKIPLASPRKKA